MEPNANPQDLQTQICKTPGLVRVCPGRPSYGSTRRVARVLPGHCALRSFDKPEPVQLPGSGSTCRAGPGLITMVTTTISK